MAKNNKTIWNPVFLSIFIANMFLNLSKQMVSVLITKYADSLGAGETMVGIVSGAFAVTALIFKLFSGPVNDRFSRKYVLMFATVAMAASYIGYGMSTTVSGLIVFRLLQGAGQAFTATVCLALASDSLPTEKFSSGISIFSLGSVICQTIGPTLGLGLADLFGYRVTFYMGASVMILATLIASQVKVQENTNHKKFQLSFRGFFAPEATLPAVIMMLLSFSFACIHSFLVIYAVKQGVDDTAIGLYFTVYAIAMLFSRPLVGKLIDRWGTVPIILPALMCYAVSFLIVSFSTTLGMFLLAAVVAAFGYGASQPSVQALCMKCVSRERRGAASSTNYIGDDLGNMLGPVVGGALASGVGYVYMWRFMLLPILLAAVTIFIRRKKIRNIEKEFMKNST